MIKETTEVTVQAEPNHPLSVDANESANEQQSVAPVINENQKDVDESQDSKGVNVADVQQEPEVTDQEILQDNQRKLEWDNLPTEEKVLRALIIYSLLDLEKKGFVLCRIKINRDLYPKHVKALEKSIKKLGGAIMPVIFLQASELINEGLTLVDKKNKEIPSDAPDLDRYLVIIDGQHRWEAWNNLRAKGEECNLYGMLPMVEQAPVTLLQDINTLVHAWTGLDYTTQAIQTMIDKNIVPDATMWYKEIAHQNGISNSAASVWASNYIVSKARMKNAISHADTDSSELKQLFDNEYLEQRKKLFEATVRKLDNKIAGLKVVPMELFAILEKMNKAKKYDKVSMTEKYEKLIGFVNGLTEDNVKAIKGAKNDKRRNKKKDDVIATEIQKAWKEFEKAL